MYIYIHNYMYIYIQLCIYIYVNMSSTKINWSNQIIILINILKSKFHKIMFNHIRINMDWIHLMISWIQSRYLWFWPIPFSSLIGMHWYRTKSMQCSNAYTPVHFRHFMKLSDFTNYVQKPMQRLQLTFGTKGLFLRSAACTGSK